MNVINTELYIKNEKDLLAFRGIRVNLDDIVQYIIFQDIVNLRIKWDIWNKMAINANYLKRRDLREEVMLDISTTIGHMEAYLGNLVNDDRS